MQENGQYGLNEVNLGNSQFQNTWGQGRIMRGHCAAAPADNYYGA